MKCCHDGRKENIFSKFFKRIQDANSLQSYAKRKLVLVGTPNVGKSVIFNKLTGAYATVSNYPGTTVEVFRGTSRIGGELFEVIDTPGMYSLMPITEEERVTRTLLLNESPDIVLHVVDAKNIERMLSMTLQLKEAGFPIILVVNMMDEAERIGREIDLEKLSALIDVPVVGTSAALNRGMDRLRKKVAEYVKKRAA
ncbi:MAG: 50S ribosome-binding GTPase [Thermosediminibacteraceae bacterium]|nr:50S ribosome-binding GTPase [Thermosediminibacteraceae bacterium]